MSGERIYLYDSTLRDGAQTRGVDFTAADKAAIARELDRLGIDYIEGGWPGANQTDDAFFGDLPRMQRARISAFGMTRRSGRSAENDPGLSAVLNAPVQAVCLVGKSWDFQATVALGVDLDENLRMVSDSIGHAARVKAEAMFDAEHFFDGYKANPDYALACVRAAYQAGARWVVLCDTNGGTLPHEIEDIVSHVATIVPGERLGIHCHDDTGNAVANSLAAVRAGVRQIQGTLNGLGERCGNANLVTLLPTLMLKMGYTTGVDEAGLAHLTSVSRAFDERMNRAPNIHAPYVGAAAFAHKGGLHASAVLKDPRAYEHIRPEQVGNQRHVLVSDQAGRANLLARLAEIGIEVDPSDPRLPTLLEQVKANEHMGYAYDGAEASLELLARRALGEVPEYFRLLSFRVIDERRYNARGELVTLSEATIKISVGGVPVMAVAEGNGPVNALDTALRRAIAQTYQPVRDMRLVDYKVRIMSAPDGTGTDAVTRVVIESADTAGDHWSTVGVSANVVNASYEALADGITWRLYRAGGSVQAAAEVAAANSVA
ncbi:citramalate synthase [Tistrella sp.]|uniref:citramalate synthase n=1 Tax=Tistrella sp. TaxID=2024861 RepID=UPI000C92FF20|nr:citramalate synthase [Tistrella sp.]MAD39477.1 citramalate synthase [Tistrella sp.]